MDTWRYYDITHRDHVVCNPTGVERLDEIVGLLDLPPGAAVLDAGCGKGELLMRIVERWGGPGDAGIRATAIDLSPYVVRELRGALERRIPDAHVEVLEMDAGAYEAPPGTFHLACGLGVSWAWGGHRGALRSLSAMVRPGGLVLVGEPWWRREPDPAYLAFSDITRDQFGTHEENVQAGVDLGLVPLLAYASTGAEWDRYETLQWRAAARHAVAHPDDPDVPDLLERVARARHEYLAWGRETLGWSLYLFGVAG
jgi:SAM-dependent methyltransferase